MLIFVALMAAFVGYVLLGTNVVLGRSVIISLFGAIPVVGEDIVLGFAAITRFWHHTEPLLLQENCCIAHCC